MKEILADLEQKIENCESEKIKITINVEEYDEEKRETAQDLNDEEGKRDV